MPTSLYTFLFRVRVVLGGGELAEFEPTLDFPGTDAPVDVFVHGGASEVRAVRRHLVGERGIDKDTASISPYWRRTMDDEQWRAVKRDWIADQANDV